MPRRKWTTLLVVIAMAAALHGCGEDSTTAPPPGPSAPLFAAEGTDGYPVKLIDYRGQHLLFVFWATWCGPCRSLVAVASQLQAELGSRGFSVVGLSLDADRAAALRYLDENPAGFRNGWGTSEIAESYGGVYGFPTCYLIDPKGYILAKYVGYRDAAFLRSEIEKHLP